MLAGLFLFDVAGLASLLADAEDAAFVLALIAVQFAVGFATFTVATAVFLMAPDAEPTPCRKPIPANVSLRGRLHHATDRDRS